jgi:ketosteroid isomerase-like protein
MTTTCLSSALMVGLVCIATIRSVHGQAPPDALKQDLIRIDQEWGKATLVSDEQVLARLLADDFVAVDLTGEVIDKKQYIDRTRSSVRSSPNSAYQANDYVIRLINETTAIMIHRGIFTRTENGTTAKEMHRSMHVFAKYQNLWRVIASEEVALSR